MSEVFVQRRGLLFCFRLFAGGEVRIFFFFHEKRRHFGTQGTAVTDPNEKKHTRTHNVQPLFPVSRSLFDFPLGTRKNLLKRIFCFRPLANTSGYE